MRKAILIISIIILTLLFCGCGNIDITCSIDDELNSEMNIDILIPKDSLDENEIEKVSINLWVLVQYWKSSGYEVEYDNNDDTYDINLKMSDSNDTLEGAYDNLTEMMSMDISPFSYVEGGYSPSYFNDIYNIKAEVDITKLVDYNTIESFPLTQKNKVYSALEKVKGSLTFDLTGESVDEAGNVSNSTNTTPISLSETVSLSKIMKIKNLDNQDKFDILENEISVLSEQTRKYTILVAILAFCLLVTIILIIIFSVKRSKAKKASQETSH